MKENRKKLVYLVQLALLTAIIVVMAFTPLGYLKIGLLSITFLTIPVIIGAVAMGPDVYKRQLPMAASLERWLTANALEAISLRTSTATKTR